MVLPRDRGTLIDIMKRIESNHPGARAPWALKQSLGNRGEGVRVVYNRTEIPRVVAVIGCQRAWRQRNDEHDQTPIPRSQWDGMSHGERKRLRYFETLVATGEYKS